MRLAVLISSPLLAPRVVNCNLYPSLPNSLENTKCWWCSWLVNNQNPAPPEDHRHHDGKRDHWATHWWCVRKIGRTWWWYNLANTAATISTHCCHSSPRLLVSMIMLYVIVRICSLPISTCLDYLFEWSVNDHNDHSGNDDDYSDDLTPSPILAAPLTSDYLEDDEDAYVVNQRLASVSNHSIHPIASSSPPPSPPSVSDCCIRWWSWGVAWWWLEEDDNDEVGDDGAYIYRFRCPPHFYLTSLSSGTRWPHNPPCLSLLPMICWHSISVVCL